jgi:AcrR family transcriptional regulator
VARTLNPETHAIRRDSFVEAAQGLIRTRGYEQTSVQDVLDAVGASRGAFYHYFDGKAALLDAVIDRMVEDGIAHVQPVVDDPTRSAIDKLGAFFTGIADWKWEQRDLVLGLFRLWLSDDNAVVREKYRRRTAARIGPVFGRILGQGRDEGTMQVDAPESTGRVLAAVILGVQEVAIGLFIEYEAGRRTPESIEEELLAYVAAFERIAGVQAGSIAVFQRGIVRQWFG